MMPLSAVEGTSTTASVRPPRLGELTAGINGVTMTSEKNTIASYIVLQTLNLNNFRRRFEADVTLYMTYIHVISYLLLPVKCCQFGQRRQILPPRKHHSLVVH